MGHEEYYKLLATEHNKQVALQKEIDGNWSIKEILVAVEQLLSK